MTIDIFHPPQGGPWGPGIPYHVRDLAAQPVTPPASWEIWAEDLQLTNTPIVRHSLPFEGNIANVIFAGVLGAPTNNLSILPASRTLTLDGAPVQLRARLLGAAGSQLVEEKTQPMVWDASYAWTLPSATQGGFTAQDREDLVLVKGSVSYSVPGAIAGATQLVRLADLSPFAVPRSLLRPFGSLLLEGRGTIPVNTAGALFTWGGTWTWVRIPPEWSVTDGVLRRWGNRVLQLEIIREGLDDTLYIDNVVEENSEGGHILWAVPGPTQIAYDLRPGWQAAWQWLVFP